jgi:hypothetical protein
MKSPRVKIFFRTGSITQTPVLSFAEAPDFSRATIRFFGVPQNRRL